MPRKRTANKSSEVFDPNFSDKQHVAAHALAFSGYRIGTRTPRGSVILAASKAGVSRQMLHRWMQIPGYVDLIGRMKAEAGYTAWGGLVRGAEADNQAACESLLNRIEPDLDPKFRLEKERQKERRQAARDEHERRKEIIELEHQKALELIEARARAGLPPEGEGRHFTLLVGEYGQEGFEDVPAPEERH